MSIHLSQASGELSKNEQESATCFRDTDSNGARHQDLPMANSVVASCQSGDTGDKKLTTRKTKRGESSATKSRKRKGRSDNTASNSKDREGSPRPPAKSPKVNETQTADRFKTRRRRSI